MTYNLPAHGEPNWDGKLDPSLQYLKDKAEAAETPAGAQAKADSAYSAAVSTASTDAQTKANAARDAAISAASTDATTKANSAQSNAIATAASDATNKANTVQANLDSHAGNVANPHAVTKAQVGLGNVDNTSDANKPVSTAQQAALDELDAAYTKVSEAPINALRYGAVGNGSTDNATAFTSLANAVNAMSGTHAIDVLIPAGTYLYTGGLVFTRPVRLIGEKGTTLNYTGTGVAVVMGVNGITSQANAQNRPYTVQGLRFTGGANMLQGLWFYNFTAAPRVLDVEFYNFGSPTGYAVYLEGNNWDTVMDRVSWYGDGTAKRNWVLVNNHGINATRLRMSNCTGTGYALGGTGVYLDGANNVISNCKIEGFAPNVWLGDLATDALITGSYFEVFNDTPCIKFCATGSSVFLQGLTVRDVYVNMHNTDNSYLSYFVEPASTTAALQYAAFERVHVENGNRELVKLNNLFSQNGNRAQDIRGTTGVYTAGANLSPWVVSEFNGNYLWVDSTGRLRVKTSVPTTDTDGTVVGSQV